ncbi:MFS transporter [Oleiphilus sp. HI0009]|uniref:VC0807 family protein n=1 Tax=unclassified Oleiphilus TaxID=2631174 RepID=UPI0007C30FFC|nr:MULTISPECIES: VC0807 family protein [unclassified Oleiphilus]KZX77777.1 MFS transporter [Oleiphilus sp. HI0009]KZX84784.1 MFS transporter [Oleiphilus sp. HI0009]KZY66487.1 MFS transporter [Oleiphilus sp. HI0066]KZY72024.1 MFS transporter [Oleiphilus sp. HI0067]
MTQPNQKANSGNIYLELILCVILPTLVLKYLSPEDQLGPVYGLILGLSLPLGYGIYQFVQEKKFGFIPALGFISILLTSSIGLLELDSKYIAIKEAAIPLIIGIGTIISLKTPYPLVKTFIYNDKILQIDKVDAALAENQSQGLFEDALKIATYILAASFLLSAILNYVLAKVIVTSPSGTAEFNDQLGTMNLLSYPVITIPCVIVMIIAMMYLFKKIKSLTGLALEDILHS